MTIEDYRRFYAEEVRYGAGPGRPTALARWLDALRLQSGDHTDHLGCGVIGVEYEAELAARAQGGSCDAILMCNLYVHSR